MYLSFSNVWIVNATCQCMTDEAFNQSLAQLPLPSLFNNILRCLHVLYLKIYSTAVHSLKYWSIILTLFRLSQAMQLILPWYKLLCFLNCLIRFNCRSVIFIAFHSDFLGKTMTCRNIIGPLNDSILFCNFKW